jgi:hypothetical protein
VVIPGSGGHDSSVSPVGPPPVSVVAPATSPPPTSRPFATSTVPSTPSMTAPASPLSAKGAGPVSSWRVSTAGYGPLRVGMTNAQLNAALGGTLTLSAGGVPIQTCGYGSSRELPADVVLLITNGSYVATVIGGFGASPSSGVSTASGIHLGMPEADLVVALGSAATKQPGTYGGTQYRVLDRNDLGAAAVVVKSGQVTEIVEGLRPAPFADEFCS